jgi:hypothetical protein
MLAPLTLEGWRHHCPQKDFVSWIEDRSRLRVRRIRGVAARR